MYLFTLGPYPQRIQVFFVRLHLLWKKLVEQVLTLPLLFKIVLGPLLNYTQTVLK